MTLLIEKFVSLTLVHYLVILEANISRICELFQGEAFLCESQIKAYLLIVTLREKGD